MCEETGMCADGNVRAHTHVHNSEMICDLDPSYVKVSVFAVVDARRLLVMVGDLVVIVCGLVIVGDVITVCALRRRAHVRRCVLVLVKISLTALGFASRAPRRRCCSVRERQGACGLPMRCRAGTVARDLTCTLHIL